LAKDPIGKCSKLKANSQKLVAAFMIRIILHVDMDAFFAAVEQRDHPEYRNKPLIVGADPKSGKGRGIVATCSYEARKFGIHSAQPISRAWKLCPSGIYVRGDMDKYVRVSERIMDILSGFSDMVEPVSIDEAFLDVTGSARLFGCGFEMAKKIKYEIRKQLGLTASVGVAGNKFVAKVASDLEKPDGLVVVKSGQEKEFLAPLPIKCLWGVGAKTEAQLKSLGFARIEQLAKLTQAEVRNLLGNVGEHLWHLARGIDDRPVAADEGFKSIGHEFTFEHDTSDPEKLHDTLLELAEHVAQRLRLNAARARTIVVKLREADFSTTTKRASLAEPGDTTEAVFPLAFRLMNSLVRQGKLVRLIGVYATNLEVQSAGAQMGLFEQAPEKKRRLAHALDEVTRRYGKNALVRAALVKKTPPE
jgi:DNA polymerase IV